MDSNKKIPWNSSTKINDTEVAGGPTASRDISNYRQRQPSINEQKIPQSEVINRLKSLSEAINETSAENASLGKEVTDILTKFGVEPHSLSREVRDGLDKVSAILKKESLGEVNETALTMHMEKKKVDELLASREDKLFKKQYEELCSQYGKLEEKLSKVQQKVSALTQLVSSAKLDDEIDYSDMILAATKLNDYKKTCDNLDEEMAAMQLTEDYSDKIVGKYKQCMQSTGELAEINKLLSQYGNLPPDILEAKAFLEEREKRRQELKRLLDDKLNKL